MAEIDQLKRAIQRSSELAKSGEERKALKLLDDSLAEAIRNNRSRWVRILSRHAATLSDSIGDLELARHYFEQSLAIDPDDPAGLYGLADVLFRQGETERAKQYAARCYLLSEQRGQERDRALMAMIAERWPELRNG